MNDIEQRFYRLTENNEACDSWVAQWRLAKKRAPLMLDLISHIFPHYSLHNASHSEAILNNISIILGKPGIENLSVVDLWLLLNAAYFHDSGMVIDGEDKKELFSSGLKFLKYIKEKQEDAASPMNAYANLLEIKDDKLYYANNELTPQSYEAVRFLIADFVRSSHAGRSAKKIVAELEGSFPTGLISQRIFGLLSQICAAHTKKREEVMELPFEQNSGCGTEPCHPRFVAFLLRLGDLLDVDNNRLSDVMLNSLGSIPVDSKDYNEINRSIRLLNINRKTIEITADCFSYRTAELTNSWFKWLNDEVVFVSQHWHLIAPGYEFGALPTIGNLEVNLKGYDTIDGKNRPVFKIDTGKAIEMIQGAGLYTNPCLCMRELLQNAVDATLLRTFKEHPEVKTYKEFFEMQKRYPIVVTLLEKKLAKDDFELTVEIKDRGIGMSKKDLEYLFNTGSSSKNVEKQELIDKMEEFMKPAGVFGIGFQSVFLVSDKVELVTRKLNKEESYQVELNNPAGIEKGAILMKTRKDDSTPVGTTVTFKTKQAAHSDKSETGPRHWDFPSFHEFYKEMDFAKAGEDVQYTIFAGLVEEVFRFGGQSPVPVELTYNGKQYRINRKEALDYYDEREGIAIEFGGPLENAYYYRNQEVDDRERFPVPAMYFKINILCGDAKEWLTLNRESLNNANRDKLRKKVHTAVARYLQQKKTTADEEQAAYISLALDSLRSEVENADGIKGVVDFDEDWKKVQLPFEKDKEILYVSVGELFDRESIIIRKSESSYRYLFFEIEKDGSIYQLKESSSKLRRGVFGYLCHKLGDYYSFVSFEKGCYTISRNRLPYVVADDVDSQFMLLLKYKKQDMMARDHFPCNDKYKHLIVSKGPQFYPIWIQVPEMVCPYRRIPNSGPYDDAKELVYDVDEKVIEFVYKHRLEESTTREQITAAYELFKQDYQEALDIVNGKKKKS